MNLTTYLRLVSRSKNGWSYISTPQYVFMAWFIVKHRDNFNFYLLPRHGGLLGSGGVAPRIPDLGTRWRWVVSFMTRPFYPQGKRPSCPFDRSLGGPQSRSGLGGEEKNSQLLPAFEPPIIQQVAHRYTTELSYQLSVRQGKVKSTLCLSSTPWRRIGWVDIYLHAFLDRDKWSDSRLGRFTPRKITPDTHWIGRRVGPRPGPYFFSHLGYFMQISANWKPVMPYEKNL
jgi:hypothetical protein